MDKQPTADHATRRQAAIDRYNVLAGLMGYVDEHGNPVKRTKHTHPYSYDGFVQWRGGDNSEANTTLYSDHLFKWNPDKYNELCLEYFGNRGQNWHQRPAEKIEAFLRDYTGDPALRLILVMEYCNQANGFPCWRFDCASSKKKS